ncbi:tubulin folding cofactor E [Actinidia rufa]|uniref:Tubulin folding cofactor E n=1 Tax=Actinidia rufa TaxID=165716 RepID=A0A7J0F957_9ERIC|nr:tubulin folding cofactor E [Actinidia rufa]
MEVVRQVVEIEWVMQVEEDGGDGMGSRGMVKDEDGGVGNSGRWRNGDGGGAMEDSSARSSGSGNGKKGEVDGLSNPEKSEFRIGQRVHSTGDTRRIGTVKYVGPVEGYSGNWVGVDWDNGASKHDGSVNGVRYFHAQSHNSASFVRPPNLSSGISLLQALEIRYKTTSTKEEEGIQLVLI